MNYSTTSRKIRSYSSFTDSMLLITVLNARCRDLWLKNVKNLPLLGLALFYASSSLNYRNVSPYFWVFRLIQLSYNSFYLIRPLATVRSISIRSWTRIRKGLLGGLLLPDNFLDVKSGFLLTVPKPGNGTIFISILEKKNSSPIGFFEI